MFVHPLASEVCDTRCGGRPTSFKLNLYFSTMGAYVFPENMCRLCIQLRTDVADIQDEEIIQLIYFVVSVQLESDNSLPKKICNRCLTLVQSWNKYKTDCIRNQVLLKEMCFPEHVLDDEDDDDALVIVIPDNEDNEETVTIQPVQEEIRPNKENTLNEGNRLNKENSPNTENGPNEENSPNAENRPNKENTPNEDVLRYEPVMTLSSDHNERIPQVIECDEGTNENDVTLSSNHDECVGELFKECDRSFNENKVRPTSQETVIHDNNEVVQSSSHERIEQVVEYDECIETTIESQTRAVTVGTSPKLLATFVVSRDQLTSKRSRLLGLVAAKSTARKPGGHLIIKQSPLKTAVQPKHISVLVEEFANEKNLFYKNLTVRCLTSGDWKSVCEILTFADTSNMPVSCTAIDPYLFSVTRINGMKCQECIWFIEGSDVQLEEHYKHSHPQSSVKYPCDYCGKYIQRETFCMHWIEHFLHYSCDNCTWHSCTQVALDEHVINCHNEYTCKLCQWKCSFNSDLTRHMKEVHRELQKRKSLKLKPFTSTIPLPVVNNSTYEFHPERLIRNLLNNSTLPSKNLVQRSLPEEAIVEMGKIINQKQSSFTNSSFSQLQKFLLDEFLDHIICKICKLSFKVEEYKIHCLSEHKAELTYPCDCCGLYVKEEHYLKHWAIHMMNY